MALPLWRLLTWRLDPFAGATIVQSTRPISREEAGRLTAFRFPKSARNIRFAHFREWVACETFLRFEAPVDDCLVCARDLLAAHNSRNPGQPIARLRGLTLPVDRGDASSSVLDTSWFDVNSIQRGQEGGISSSRMPRIWVDTERGVFYYTFHD
jgi:hypothetical protein